MARTPADALCRCGHTFELHEHYRRGSDCALCGEATCRKFTDSGRRESEDAGMSADRGTELDGPSAASA